MKVINLIKIIKYIDSNLLYFVEKRDSYLLLAINNYIILTNLIYSIKVLDGYFVIRI